VRHVATWVSKLAPTMKVGVLADATVKNPGASKHLGGDRSTALLCQDINVDAEDDYHIQEETEAAVACDHVHAVILS